MLSLLLEIYFTFATGFDAKPLDYRAFASMLGHYSNAYPRALHSLLPNREVIVVDKLISKYQADEYILTLPIRFVQRAFGIKADQVDVVDDVGVCYKVDVRSKPSRPRECYFGNGWKPFSQHHMLRTGSAIRLMIGTGECNGGGSYQHNHRNLSPATLCMWLGPPLLWQRFTEDSTTLLQFRLIKKRNTDGRRYNIPLASEVVALIYFALQYPLLFPYGEDGFRSDILISDERSKQQLHKRETISMREFLSFRIQMRSHESQVLLKSRRLFQQFLVDSYTMVEAERLQYHSGPRYMYNNCKDAFAICKYTGCPSYFITITCNPDWTEIKDCVADYSLKPSDRPDIISRVFKIKLDVLLKDLKDGSIFGKPKGIVYTVEFQKRGLPHCHILLFVQPAEKPRSSDEINHHISAEIPNEHTQPKLYSLVQKFMIHGPCGILNMSSPCMVNGRCSKFYPAPFREKTSIDSAGFPKYKWSDNGRSTTKRNVNLNNRFIVPYNATLLLKYGCHINVEYTCQTSAIKYLFKYIHKDEIQNYYYCRYISACEASWRLFGFEIQYKEPNVIRLPFHLPNEQNVLYKDHQLIENVIDAAVSKDRCQTFADVRSIGGIVYDTFKEACYALGLLQDDMEFIDALNEANASKGDIVLNVASSGIVALLLPNGRTAHSRFKVLLSVNQDSICNIRQGTPLARLISSSKLVIWDEAPMLNKFCFEALDKCLKDVLCFDRGYNPLFGGKIVVLGGDFRQILLVIPRGSQEDIVHSCINASNLWQSYQVLQLTENMRLPRGSRDIHGVQLKEFATWLLQIGDGLIGDSTDGESVIRIPDNLLLNIESPCLHDMVLFVYPDILLYSSSVDYFKGRSILAPTLDVVTKEFPNTG
ncbi:hypothetical protein AHAS_Ahas07G0144700 [Arachis hypogaea]